MHAATCCSRSKQAGEGLLPAVERYTSPRVAYVAAESSRLGLPLLLLSGRFGLLDAGERIPYYDDALTDDGVAPLVPIVAKQIREKGVVALAFYARARSTPGWEPYHRVLEAACDLTGIRLEWREVGDDVGE